MLAVDSFIVERHEALFRPLALTQIDNLSVLTLIEINVDRKGKHVKAEMLAFLVTCAGESLSKSGC